jgi:hypothetical protein
MGRRGAVTGADAADLIARLRAERSTLPIDREQAIVAVASGPGLDSIDVGLTAEGLIAVTFPASKVDVVFPIELRTILVTVLRQALVIRGGVESREDVVLVVCRSTDELLMQWFTRVAVALLRPAAGGGASSLTPAILQLAQLFERAQRPGKKAVVGLWAELALITAATDRVGLLSAWRDKAAEPFDFASGECRLEIKARSSSALTHYFSVEQLRPAHKKAWVIVVPVQHRGSGASIHDLAEILRQDALSDATLLAKIDRVILECLGSSYAGAANERFDLDAAKAGLELYDSAAVPCVPTPLPDGVLSARLLVDLAYVPQTEPRLLPVDAALARLPFSISA